MLKIYNAAQALSKKLNPVKTFIETGKYFTIKRLNIYFYKTYKKYKQSDVKKVLKKQF